jgi:hypothetical protein
MAVRHDSGGDGLERPERDARLDRLYRDTARDAPPPHLDAAILAAARREVGAGPRSLSTRLHTWRVPVSIAAVIVLTVSLVTLVGEEEGDRFLHETYTYTPAAPPAAQPADAEPSPAGARAGSQRPAATAAEQARSERRDERVAKSAAQSGKEADGTRPDSGPAKIRGTIAPPAPETDSRLFSKQFGGQQDAAEKPAAAPQLPAAAERAKSAPDTVARRAAPAAAAPAAPQAKPRPQAMEAQKAAPLMDRRTPVWRGLEQEPPQKWLERAIELKRQGRTSEVEELLAEFKRRFPDHRLRPELE